jgi:hypothetical protein
MYATGSYIRGTNGTSNGIVPLRVLMTLPRYVDQGGGKRKELRFTSKLGMLISLIS